MEHETRNDMIKHLQLKGNVTEIGVFRGDFSNKILELCPEVERLTLVDIWPDYQTGSGDENGNNMVNYKGIENYKYVVAIFCKNERVRIMKDSSDDYFKFTRDDVLDAVYIDGDHSYEGCLKDLEGSRRVVKPDGWILGHDYKTNHKCKENWDFGVKKAVDEFCEKYNLEISHYGLDGCVSYAIKNVKQKDINGAICACSSCPCNPAVL